jgi:endonuclease/exonuclease/phosphatase family metal-dependent hydrolase
VPRCCVYLLLLAFAGRLHGFSLLTYNVAGNGTTNWSTNTAQVQAIGRILKHLNPDVIAFNEIPRTNIWEMANWVKAFTPGYYLATNSAGDGFINNCIASRFPITRSKSWLHGSDLGPFGFTNSDFTRDLFEAEIDVSGFAQHVHVFVAHLKAFTDTNSCLKRAAEASAVSNFFTTNFVASSGHAYVLCGDMNEDVARPPDASGQPIARLANTATGLQLITPTNPISGREFTYSSTSPSERIDYIFPSASLLTNLLNSQVFRTTVLSPMPPDLQKSDDKTASDHLPVLAVFNGPDAVLKLASVSRSNQTVRLSWNTTPQRQYAIEASSNFVAWTPLVTNLLATTTNLSWSSNLAAPVRFFRVYRVP